MTGVLWGPTRLEEGLEGAAGSAFAYIRGRQEKDAKQDATETGLRPTGTP